MEIGEETRKKGKIASEVIICIGEVKEERKDEG